jgi:predicted RNase H-like HicB family nuclease
MKAEDYYNLPYKLEIIKNSDNTFFASIKELHGCMTEGDTIEEVYQMIEDAKRAWLSAAMENGNEIPLPEEMNQKSYSGKLVLRIPKELHRKLSENAENNNVSLNSYINMLLVANNSKIESLSDMIDFLTQKLYEKGQKNWQMFIDTEININCDQPENILHFEQAL